MKIKFPNIEDTDYFTNRALEDDNGEKKGKIIMWRLKGKEEFNIYLKCPFCGFEEQRTEVFKRRPYRPKCSKCGKSFMVSKIKAKKK